MVGTCSSLVPRLPAEPPLPPPVRQGQTGLSIGRVSPDRPLLAWMCGPEVYEFSGLLGMRIDRSRCASADRVAHPRPAAHPEPRPVDRV